MTIEVTSGADKPSPKTSSPKQSPAAALLARSSNGSSASNGETLRNLYAGLLRCRLVQELVGRLSCAAKYEFAIGHEAVTVGATADLGPEDTIAASPRNLSALLANGAPLQKLLIGLDHSSGVVGAITQPSLPEDPFNLGTGIALAHKLHGKQKIVVALREGEIVALEPWQEALKFAGTHKLPIVYVVKDGCSKSKDDPLAGQPAYLEQFSFMARDYGFPGIIVDGKDVVAVWRVAQESIHRARQGSGPTLIYCRQESARDPLEHMEHYMRKRSVWDEEWCKQVAARIIAEIESFSG